ncbi:MAG: tRNA 2-thiouridine(34) synthase MnmA [Flavobacteriales bacterium]|jgi:tRNA-specific 2-thiouridylase|nr:tRNA 2-thiouridine(34) synthase MnmA [Flavobacteriales bacterium]MBT4881659.1 tRNA 2-thiouridine(34) synthase MnmA [Flavobacteriales bacterium]|tara:strand:+ start:3750 stop:4838 length:1089 start_codon:yes stop_codon:yes gene_type:complete
MSKGRVLMAMSGGIDSTMASLLLHEQGYEVIGLTMKTWDYDSSGGNKKETGCCSLDSINDARQLAVDCGFPHTILDIREEFGNFIIDNFVDEYIAGRTPNPCVLCNTHIKWEALLKRADMLNCEFIATGHYAQVREEEGRFVVSKGLDDSKDQSYVLWGVTQECLKRTIFPMGEYHKKDIKQMALDRGYKALAEKSESYEICFIPDNDYRGFLKRRVEGLEEKVKGGNFVTTDGHIVGTHDGYPFYTIGQRKIGVSLGPTSTYVIEINPEDNTVVVGTKEDLQKQEMFIRNINYLKYNKIEDGMECLVKVRYKHKGEMATVTNDGDNLKVLFHKKVEGIAPGQSAAIYEGNDLIAGGFIMKK